MKTDRFNEIREKILNEKFSKKNITDVWRKIVKNQLRSLDLKDIYDYYDFNYAINDRAVSIRGNILEGNCKAQTPFLYLGLKKIRNL